MERDENLEALTSILSSLKKLDKDAQKRTLQAVIMYLGIDLSSVTTVTSSPKMQPLSVPEHSNGAIEKISFSENRNISPKDFLKDKSPVTDVERIACLAYYLTHYRDVPHFKTLELSRLNVEAAQPKFSNPAVAVDNATRAGLLVQATKGSKQISAVGEVYVQALPDRNIAKAAIASMRKKRTKKAPTKVVKNKK